MAWRAGGPVRHLLMEDHGMQRIASSRPLWARASALCAPVVLLVAFVAAACALCVPALADGSITANPSSVYVTEPFTVTATPTNAGDTVVIFAEGCGVSPNSATLPQNGQYTCTFTPTTPGTVSLTANDEYNSSVIALNEIGVAVNPITNVWSPFPAMTDSVIPANIDVNNNDAPLTLFETAGGEGEFQVTVNDQDTMTPVYPTNQQGTLLSGTGPYVTTLTATAGAEFGIDQNNPIPTGSRTLTGQVVSADLYVNDDATNGLAISVTANTVDEGAPSARFPSHRFGSFVWTSDKARLTIYIISRFNY